jgi:diadenosine tetraphosphate (Ap4A) HIT family hydrolase
MTERSWPEDWEQRRAVLNCPGCGDGRPDEDEHGVRYLSIDHADAYLQRVTPVPGYSTVVFRGRHVADPTELGPEETVAFWSAAAIAARAIEAVFWPCHLNSQIFGNAMPHAHVTLCPGTSPTPPRGDF